MNFAACPSADLQSAVSQNCILRAVGNSECMVTIGAVPIANRRYSRLQICAAPLSAARGLVFLIFALCFPAAGQTVDPYGDLLDRQLAVQPAASSAAGLDPAKMTAEDWRVFDLRSAIKIEAQKMAAGPLVAAPSAVSRDHNGLVLVMALLLAAAAGLWKLVDVFNRRFRFRAKSDNRWQNLLMEDPSLAGFFTELRDGLSASPLCNVSESLDSLNGLQPQTGEDPATDPLQELNQRGHRGRSAPGILCRGAQSGREPPEAILRNQPRRRRGHP